MNNVPEGFMENASGDLVRIENVKAEHLEEDALVKEIAAAAETLNARLAEFKASAMGDIAAFLDLLAEKYDAPRRSRKGNHTLTTFDGRLRVRVQVSEHQVFGPELEAAKELIDQCILRWGENADPRIQTLVGDAFKVNKQGKVDMNRILGLRRLDMGDDADWAKAMEAIGDSLRTVGSKTYLRIYRADPKTGDETPISLDLANV